MSIQTLQEMLNVITKIDKNALVDYKNEGIVVQGNFASIHPEHKFHLEQLGVSPSNIHDFEIDLEVK